MVGARLVESSLMGAKLAGADLSGADLSGADATSASCAGATLHRARLVEANLAGANLDGADLRGADLTDAGLEGASLERVDLSAAVLEGARFEGARMREVRAFGSDLSSARLSVEQRAGIIGGLHGADVGRPAFGHAADDDALATPRPASAVGDPPGDLLVELLGTATGRNTFEPSADGGPADSGEEGSADGG